MSILNLHKSQNYIFLDEGECREAGRMRSATYQNARPFPHIVMENFLDATFLRNVAVNFPQSNGKQFFNRDQERLKFQFAPWEVSDGLIKNLLSELNGHALIGFLEELTGINGLIGDPYFSGGGLHETKSGGHLSVHADFNIHENMKVERRLNLLIYLNHDWPTEFGGELELWSRDMASCERRVAPRLGTAVVFNTSHDSFHGQPDPVRSPPERSRRSIATYYYTALADGLNTNQSRNTTFRVRPGSEDRRDNAVAFQHFISDWVPPRLQRYANRLNPFR